MICNAPLLLVVLCLLCCLIAMGHSESLSSLSPFIDVGGERHCTLARRGRHRLATAIMVLI